MADALPGAAAPIPAAVRAALSTQTTPDAAELRHRATRLLALVDMARALPRGDYGLPEGGDSTDAGDKLAALLLGLTAELQSLHSYVCDDEPGSGSLAAAVPPVAAPAAVPAWPVPAASTLPASDTSPAPIRTAERQSQLVDPLHPVPLLRSLDAWMHASGYGDEHPWRVCIGATLKAHGTGAAVVSAKRAADVFSEIATLADCLDTLLRVVMQGEVGLWPAAFSAAAHLGHVADAAAEAHGNSSLRGGAAGWFLVPAVGEALEAAMRAVSTEGGAA